jgi:C-terminal processing protease CtpA/Prc
MLDDGFVYLRISQFQSNSGDDFTKIIQTLKKNNGGKKNLMLLHPF